MFIISKSLVVDFPDDPDIEFLANSWKIANFVFVHTFCLDSGKPGSRNLVNAASLKRLIFCIELLLTLPARSKLKNVLNRRVARPVNALGYNILFDYIFLRAA